MSSFEKSTANGDDESLRVTKKHHLAFESFGVRAIIESDTEEAVLLFHDILPNIFAGNYRESDFKAAPHLFTYEWNFDELDSLYENGHWVYILEERQRLVEIFVSRIRLLVAEYAAEHVFVHAGVVSINGQGVIIPGRSMTGKTTLVAELVRKGADYYSDEYAVFDSEGLVRPFTKPLSIRKEGGTQQTDIAVEILGGVAGLVPLPVTLILFTKFDKKAFWNPRTLKKAESLMELIRDTIPIRRNPQFTLDVLGKVIERAKAIKSKRNEAAEAASKLIEMACKEN